MFLCFFKAAANIGTSFDQRLHLCKVLKGFQVRAITINRVIAYMTSDEYTKWIVTELQNNTQEAPERNYRNYGDSQLMLLWQKTLQYTLKFHKLLNSYLKIDDLYLTVFTDLKMIFIYLFYSGLFIFKCWTCCYLFDSKNHWINIFSCTLPAGLHFFCSLINLFIFFTLNMLQQDNCFNSL